jgi:hypothetical protein
MPSLRFLLPTSLAVLCGQAFCDQGPHTATEACLDLAGRSLQNNPQLEQRWRDSWVDARSIREESYDGEIEGRKASKQLTFNLRQDRWVDGRLVCFLTQDGEALSAEYKAESNNSELPPF